jgi:glycosyltransferase involved in cell wall biosynthesis
MTSRDITHPQWAGGDVYHFEIARRLVECGNEVVMLCSKYSGYKDQEELQGIRIIRIRGGIFRIFSNFLTYRRYLRGKQDVIVEEAEGPAGPLFAFLYAREPVVIMWHQLGKVIYFEQFPFLIALILFMMEKIYAALAHKCLIIVPSDERAQEFERLGFSTREINVVPAAVATKESSKQSRQAAYERPYFVVLGKIRRYKAYHHAVEALRLSRERRETYALVIAGRRGEEKYLDELGKLIAKYGLHDSVLVRLNVSEEEKTRLLSGAIALIVTSPIEGFSIASAEANALGVPVIATKGVPNEVVCHGFNGIKYDFGDVRALADAMSELVHDRKLRDKLSKNALESSDRFSWDRSAKLFKAVLQRATKK